MSVIFGIIKYCDLEMIYIRISCFVLNTVICWVFIYLLYAACILNLESGIYFIQNFRLCYFIQKYCTNNFFLN